MQEQGGRQEARHQVPEINHLVEIVELAGVVKAQRDEAGQAQNIKVPGLLRAAPPEVDEQPDDQVRGPHRVLVDDRPVQRLLRHHQGRRQFHAAALQPVLRPAPRADPHQHLGHIRGLLDLDPVDVQQAVGAVDPGIQARTRRFHVQRFHAALPVYPDHTVFRKPEPVLLLKVNERRHAGRKREDGEDRGGQLELEFLEHSGRRRRRSETIIRDLRSTFDAAVNLEFYNQIILIFYNLQAAPGNLSAFWEKHTMQKCIRLPQSRGAHGAAKVLPTALYPLVLLGYRRKREAFEFVQMAVLEPACSGPGMLYTIRSVSSIWRCQRELQAALPVEDVLEVHS